MEMLCFFNSDMVKTVHYLPLNIRMIMRAKIGIAVLVFVIIVVLAIKYTIPKSQVSEKVSTKKETVAKDNAARFYEKIDAYKSIAPSKLQLLEQQVNAKQAFDRKDWYGARENFMRVVANNPQDFQAWLFLCKTLQEMKNLDPTYSEYAEEVNAACAKATQLAKTALDKDLIKQLASPQDPKVKERLHALLNTYPSEFAPYFLDIPQQTEVGTACVSFTYPLLQNRDFHYEDRITLEPKVKDLGVIARGNKLCFEGLQFGENYQLTFKQGLPGEQNTKLEKDQKLPLYIPHRKPTIRFRERGYILSSAGEQVVPFVAVNVPKVQVKIIHVPERNIQSVQANWFSNQIGPWEADSLRDEHGEIIWEGTYFCENELNKTGITGLPIDKMIGKNLEPGVYVIEARVADRSYDSNEYSSQALIVSDIGLSTYSGPDGLHVMARDLNTAKPMEGVLVTLVARNNRELKSGKTDNSGFVHFADSAINGIGGNMPAFLTASRNTKQFTVLNLRNESFDLSDRGAKGSDLNGPVSAYVFSERGIYRPGEIAHINALLRKENGEAEKEVPLTLMIYRPDGVLVQTTVLKDLGIGSYQFDYPINQAAHTGTWSGRVYLDPKAEDIGRFSFEVNDFVPPRIEVKAKSEMKSVLPRESLPILVSAQYYFGPYASDLKVEAESFLSIAKQPFPQWQGYQFGLEEEIFAPLRFNLKPTLTDSKGEATLEAQIDVRPQSSHPLQIETVATVFEVGGRGRQAKQVTEFWHQPFVLGIKPRFSDREVPQNHKAGFDLIALNQQGQLQNKENLSYTLFSEQQDYIWFREGNQWQYEVVTRDRIVSNGKITLTAIEPKLLEVPVASGMYRLEILDDKTGVATSFRFAAGWFYANEAPDKPDILELKVENEKVYVKSPFAGEMVLALGGQTFKSLYTGKIGQEGITLELPALMENVPTGAYLIGTVFRPADIKSAQMPGRAIGLTWFNNDKSLAKHKIDVAIEAPTQAKSKTTIEVNIKVPPEHAHMRVLAALVDEATLSLVDFKSPDPFAYFFSQRELAYQLRDSYGFLINPFGAKPGSFEEGGDGDNANISQRAFAKLPAKSYKVVSLTSGIIDATDKYVLRIPFTIPEYSGKLRLMAVAWDEKGLGHAASNIIVRDEVDIYFVLPRFLAPGDKVNIPLILRNLEGKAGDYSLKLTGEKLNIEKKFSLKKDEEKQIPIDLRFDRQGVKSLQLTLEGPDNFKIERSWEISVRPRVQPLAMQQFGVLAPQKSLTLEESLFKNLENTSYTYLTVGSMPDFGSDELSKELMHYPYLCLEQTTSKMLATGLSSHADKSSLNQAFNQLSSLQKIDGSFGLWSSTNRTESWLSLYASDVMAILEKQGLSMPTAIKDNLNNYVNEIQQTDNISLTAYANYLNAKSAKSTLGALRYFVETHQQQIISKQDQAFIAAAFAYYGEQTLALEWFNKAILAPFANKQDHERYFGSDLRDLSILVTLLAETTKNHPKLFELANNLSAKANESKYLSTQEKAWLIRAAYQLRELQKEYQLDVGGETVKGQQPLQKIYTKADLKKPITIHNQGGNPVFYSLSTQGEPVSLNQLNQQGFTLDHIIYTLKGEEASLKHLKSGERYLVIIKGQRLNDSLRHILLVDLLPAGLEIEEPNLLKDNMVSVFPWLETLTPASRLEGRDDRFVGAYELEGEGRFTAAYLVRAVSKGNFIMPAVYCEAMYQPQNFKYGKEQVLKIE